MSVKIEDNAENREALDQHFQKSAEQGREFEQVEEVSPEDIMKFLESFDRVKSDGNLLALIGNPAKATGLVIKGQRKAIMVTLAYAIMRDKFLAEIVTKSLEMALRFAGHLIESDEEVELGSIDIPEASEVEQ